MDGLMHVKVILIDPICINFPEIFAVWCGFRLIYINDVGGQKRDRLLYAIWVIFSGIFGLFTTEALRTLRGRWAIDFEEDLRPNAFITRTLPLKLSAV